MPRLTTAIADTGRFSRSVKWGDEAGKPRLRPGEVECVDAQGDPAHRPAEDHVWNSGTRSWEFSQALRDELDHAESDDGKVEAAMHGKSILKALALVCAEQFGMTAAQMRAAIKAKM